MQTFLPTSTIITFSSINTSEQHAQLNSCFAKIASQLDNKRLFKQALEGWQILMNLLEIDPDGNPRKPKGWSSHPAVKMWRGSELALFLYIMQMLAEWHKRGFNARMQIKVLNTSMIGKSMNKFKNKVPDWMLDSSLFDEIASSHRQALLVKNYEHYSQFNWPEDNGVEPTSYDYVWPIKGGKDEGTKILT